MIIQITYLLAAILFILGLKGLTSPRTARRGNLLSAIGMLLAVVITLFDKNILNLEWILLALLIGGIIGALLALKVKMTDMPQLVALLNGFGGLASVFVGISAFLLAQNIDIKFIVALALTQIIGALTFFGSMVAFLKLQRLISERPIYFKGQTYFNALIGLGLLTILGYMLINPLSLETLLVITLLSALLGLTLVLPIGGADMPIVVAILNSYSGLASAASGFVLGNTVLIISGSLVGASGLILTQIMCKAMNRSFLNVIFGRPSNSSKSSHDNSFYDGKIKQSSSEEAAILFESAQRVIVVPGYGLAVAQAQHLVKELDEELTKHNIDLKYAIHPVAGRMPGHMNVLLAEADVSYDKLIDLDTINPEFQNTDISIILGANDVVNPAASTKEDSPIYGMPILNVDKSKTVIVVKRSLSPGFAGIPNELFIKDNTLMIFGDAKQIVAEILKELRAL